MKNIIEPNIIEAFRKSTPSFEEINIFLEDKPHVSAAYFCKLIDVNIKHYYDWKHRKNKVLFKKSTDTHNLSVTPASGKNQKYSAVDKLKLVKEYLNLEEGKKTEFLRKYGLYQSDISRWIELSEAASIEALSKRKVRSDKKSETEVELEKLKKEMAFQEKTIAKLAALVVFQKKVSEIIDPA